MDFSNFCLVLVTRMGLYDLFANSVSDVSDMDDMYWICVITITVLMTYALWGNLKLILRRHHKRYLKRRAEKRLAREQAEMAERYIEAYQKILKAGDHHS